MKAKPKKQTEHVSNKELATRVEELELKTAFLIAALVVEKERSSEERKRYTEIIYELIDAIFSDATTDKSSALTDKKDLIRRAHKMLGLKPQ